MVASISLAKDKGYLIKGYYTNELEGKGEWVGQGAKRLGLSGDVEPAVFNQIWDGYSPAGKKLVQNAGSPTRQSGWDITFSPSKDVSILYGLGDVSARAKIAAAQRAAVEDAISHLEAEAAYTRQGKAGAEAVKTDGLIAAAFQHSTNRENQPQLHTHVMVFNVAPRQDGSTGSIISKRLYHANLGAGSVHSARLATELQRQGYRVERTKDGFQVNGIPEGARTAFSARSLQIAEYLEHHHLKDTPQNRDRAAEFTRAPKQATRWDELQQDWAKTGKAHGVTVRQLRSLRGKPQIIKGTALAQSQAAVVEKTAKTLSLKGEFSERELETALAQNAIGQGLTYKELAAAKDEFLMEHPVSALDGPGAQGRTFSLGSQNTVKERKLLSRANGNVSTAIAQGESETAFKVLGNNGWLVVGNDSEGIQQQLIHDWLRAGGAKNNVIVAKSSAEVDVLNRLAQERRRKAWQLGRKLKIGGHPFYEGDKVQFNKTSWEWGLKKGDVATVTKINTNALDRDMVTVTTEGGRKVTFSRKEYKALALAYATRLKDAKPVEGNTYIWSQGEWSRGQTYQAVTLASQETRIYAYGKDYGGQDAAYRALAERMSQEREKEWARQRHPYRSR